MTKISKKFSVVAAFLSSVPISVFALTVNVERMDVETGLPWGYADTTGLRACTETYSSDAFDIDLSAAPYVDYMVSFASGASGILAEKASGMYLDASQSTVDQLSGGAGGNFAEEGECGTGNSLIPVGTERFSIFAKWSDGTPLPAAVSWFGGSWGGWSNTDIEELEVRVDLASDDKINVVHWFNDGWLYSSDLDGTEGNVHTILEGHEFTVTHYSADGSVIDEKPFVLPSGGAGDAIGKTGDYLIRVRDHRQFYTATMSVTRTTPGDYLILKHRAANIGYRLTAVTLGSDTPWDEGSGPEPWFGYPVDANGWVDTSPWLNWVNVDLAPWVWTNDLGKFIYIQDDSGWIYVPN